MQRYYDILEAGKVRRENCDQRDIEEKRRNGTVIAQGDTQQECDRNLAKNTSGKADWC
jgi:hypothetical protein